MSGFSRTVTIGEAERRASLEYLARRQDDAGVLQGEVLVVRVNGAHGASAQTAEFPLSAHRASDALVSSQIWTKLGQGGNLRPFDELASAGRVQKTFKGGRR